MEKLLVGLDLCPDYTQLTCYNRRKGEPKSIGIHGDEEDYLIPFRLAVKCGSKEWVFGEEAQRMVKEKKALDAGDLFAKAALGTTTELYDVVFQPEDLLERYFRKMLLLLRQACPDGQIGCLVVTLQAGKSEKFQEKSVREKRIKIALSRLLAEECKLEVQSHMVSFLHYTIGQKKELWQNDTALFEFQEDGLHYTQLSINRREMPMVAAITERNFSDYLKLIQVKEDAETAAHIFADVAEAALYRKLLSTIYAVGRGFLTDWADGVLASLCTGRKVFRGQNLYAKGACLAALHLMEEKEEQVLFLGEERTCVELSMQVYVNGKIQQFPLLRPAMLWQEAGGEWDFILDREDVLEFSVRDYLSRKKDKYTLSLSGLPERDRKQTRIRMKVFLPEQHECRILVQDLGFGEFAPAHMEHGEDGQRWEMKIEL